MRSLGLLATCLLVLVAAPAAITHDPAVFSGRPTVSTGTRQAVPAVGPMVAGSTPFSLLQMNLCLSGLAACLRYPEAVSEAVAVIDRQRPDAVALNEVCRDDVARIAATTGYRWRFAAVPYLGRPLPCRHPAGRGLFGNAVLTRSAVTGWVAGGFTAQDVLEQRRWLCVATTQRVSVCATHLEVGISAATAAVNRRQCAELADMLAVRAARGPTLAAGDTNGYRSCAPASMWTRTDREAAKQPGVQHVYGSADHLRRPTAEIVPATTTDHDFLQVNAWLVL